MSSTQAGKDTIYIDIDDEITSVIDKVRSSDQKIVALVLPKRATVLQSIVNMKLLKRTADDAKKHLVLITNEASLLPLAGNVGLHVASTLQSKPEIPKAPVTPGDEPEDIDEPLDMAGGEEDAEDSFDHKAAASTPIGALAGKSAKATPAVDDSFELDNSDNAFDAPATPAKAKPKKNKKLKIPNFDSFRTKLLLGIVVLAVLIVGWIFAFVVMPHATVTIHTDTSTIPTNLSASINTAAKTLDPEANVIPATQQTQQKTYTQQVPTTGQQNNGQKATGTINMTVTRCAPNLGTPDPVPSGTGVSASSHTFITQDAASFSFDTFTSGSCARYKANGIDVTAIKGGSDYNMDNADFNVSGRSDVNASGSANGGTDQIIKVVSQADLDGAKSKIKATDTNGIKQDLQNNLKSKDLFPVTATFVTGDPQVTTSSSVGDQADTLTVTEVITYSMLGVDKKDLKTLIENNVNGQIDKSKQVILDDGVDQANFNVQNQISQTNFSVAISTKSVAGPDIDTSVLPKQLAGKKSGDIKKQLKAIPGVTDVDVKYSPFWVSSTPKSAGKITVQLDKANTGQS